MVEAVIFDMDGLMFDTESVWTSLWEPVLASFNIPLPEGLAEATRGTAGAQLESIVSHYCGKTVPARVILEEMWRQGDAIFAKGVAKKPGLDELLVWLRAHGIPMAVASSSLPHYIRQNLKTGGIEQYFSAIVSGDMIEYSKPAPDIFLKAAELLHSDRHHTLVLEDSFNGVRAGRAGDFITVMVPDLLQPDGEMAHLYDACCKELFEVRELLQKGRLE